MRPSNEMNLNKIEVPNDGSGHHQREAHVECDDVEVLFEGQKKRIIELIKESTMVVGCVAWLTDFDILTALKGRPVSIIIQKEDFLRPDLRSRGNFNSKLRQAYESLSGFYREELTVALSTSNFSWEDKEKAIRCAGLANLQKKSAWPRMHHKFMLFRALPLGSVDGYQMPSVSEGFQTVVTGSYNMTHNAVNSLENMVVITKKPIVDAYYGEFEKIFCLSEPLDWKSAWVAPEYRIGT